MGKHKKPEGPLPLPESVNLPCVGVETHAHLDLHHFNEDFDEVLRRAKRSGVSAIGQVFLSPEAWRKQQARFAPNPDYPEFFFLLGIHPTDGLELFNGQTIDELRRIVRQEARQGGRIRAIGEIGLDYYWKDCPQDLQKDIFAQQLDLARELNLPVAIHCRDAVDDTMRILLDRGFSGYPLLWHCFNGDYDMAMKVVNNGWHVSIPGPVSFPANKSLREAVAAIPLDRLMVETDCPYMSPVPYRGRRNEPAYLAFTITGMAEAREMSPAELWRICGDNARRFFNIV